MTKHVLVTYLSSR